MIEVLSQPRVKTRKPHCCWGCARTFPAGTEMDCINSVEVFDGKKRAVSTYWCDVCQHVWSEDYHTDDMVDFGDVKANDPEAWAQSKAAIAAAGKVKHDGN